jgi:hypothetical protein
MSLLRHRATGIWLILVIATGFSWWFGTNHQVHADHYGLETTIGLMLIAFFKVRLVIRYFMQTRHAPLVVRVIGDVWVVGVCAAILGVYVLVK